MGRCVCVGAGWGVGGIVAGINFPETILMELPDIIYSSTSMVFKHDEYMPANTAG